MFNAIFVTSCYGMSGFPFKVRVHLFYPDYDVRVRLQWSPSLDKHLFVAKRERKPLFLNNTVLKAGKKNTRRNVPCLNLR